MSIRFAGSRCVDERRRRRLAQEADAALDPVTRRRAATATDEAGKLPRGSSPVDSLISPRLWKHSLVAAAVLLAWGAVLIVGERADQARAGLESIVGLAAGKLTTFFSTVMLLAAGQLAFINLWYRSRSRKDFSGSYKLWFYTAVGWLVLCAFRATGAHWNFADAALAGRPMAIWNARLMLWLIPAAIVVVSLYRLLLREMRDCSLSLWTLRLSGVAACGAALAVIVGPLTLSARQELLAAAGMSTLWHALLAVSMLLHTRHVIHVSNEPPQRPIARWRMPRLGWPRIRREKPARAASEDPAPRTARRKPKRAVRKGDEARAAGRADAPADGEVPDSPPAVDEPQASGDESAFGALKPPAAPPGAPPAAVTTPPSAPVRRIDPPQSVGPAQPHYSTSSRSREEEPDDASDAEWTDEEPEARQRPLSKKERRRQQKLARGR